MSMYKRNVNNAKKSPRETIHNEVVILTLNNSQLIERIVLTEEAKKRLTVNIEKLEANVLSSVNSSN